MTANPEHPRIAGIHLPAGTPMPTPGQIRDASKAGKLKTAVVWLRIQSGDRYEEIATLNADLMLKDPAVRRAFMAGVEAKILGVIAAAMKDRGS